MLNKIGVLSLVVVIAILIYAHIEPPHTLVEEEYVVKSGDTFWSICEDFRSKNTHKTVYILTYIEDMKEANKELESSNYQVVPGQKIKVVYKVAKEDK